MTDPQAAGPRHWVLALSVALIAVSVGLGLFAVLVAGPQWGQWWGLGSVAIGLIGGLSLLSTERKRGRKSDGP